MVRLPGSDQVLKRNRRLRASRVLSSPPPPRATASLPDSAGGCAFCQKAYTPSIPTLQAASAITATSQQSRFHTETLETAAQDVDLRQVGRRRFFHSFHTSFHPPLARLTLTRLPPPR